MVYYFVKHIRRSGKISLFPLPPLPGPASSIFRPVDSSFVNLDCKNAKKFPKKHLHLGFKFAVYYDDYRNWALLFFCRHGFAGFGTGNLVDFGVLRC